MDGNGCRPGRRRIARAVSSALRVFRQPHLFQPLHEELCFGLCIRPQDVRVDDGLGNRNCVVARVESVQWLGATQRLVASFGALSIRVDHPGSLAAPKTGDTVKLVFDPWRAVLLADAS